MKKKILAALVVSAILLLAGLLYFYKLNTIPSGFYVDEATVSYNAYSILKTGRDEYGVSYPIIFRLMGSYSPGLFIYLSALLMKYFGMDPVVTRSATAFGVILSIPIFYFLIRKLKLFESELTYFTATLFYAISPWLVFNARLGYETTMGFVIFSIGAYFLFLSYKNPRNLIFSVLFLSLSTYTSHNQRFLAPLFLLAVLILFRKKIFTKKNLKVILVSFVLGMVLQIPHLSIIGTNAFWIKKSQFNLTHFWNLITYLSPKTLFYDSPDIDMQHELPKLSMFYNWMAIPYLIGIYLLLKRIKDYRYSFLAIYLMLPLIPSVLSSPFISNQKILPIIVPLTTIVGLGIDTISIKLKPKYLQIPLIAIVSVYSLVALYSSYFILFPKEQGYAWNYGYSEVAAYIQNRPEEKFLVDDTRNPRTYILLLYYLRYDPKEYQKELGKFYKDNYYLAPPPASSYRFANVEVRPINWKEDPKRDLIIIGDPLTISEQQAKEHKLTKLDKFEGPSGETILEVYKTDIR